MADCIRIEVLVLPWSLNAGRVMRAVAQVAAELGLRIDLECRAVESEARARSIGFLGAPTVLVDGVDVVEEPGGVPVLGIRRYDGAFGMPPRAAVEARLRAAAAARGMPCATSARGG
ncbi:MAG: hypothetical protein FJ087_14480 [Deltaproteobacteria bacterium]|nr:hypothetical protein [Deltaproteobacteria bacterium]